MPPEYYRYIGWLSWMGDISVDLILPAGCFGTPHERLVVTGVVPIVLMVLIALGNVGIALIIHAIHIVHDKLDEAEEATAASGARDRRSSLAESSILMQNRRRHAKWMREHKEQLKNRHGAHSIAHHLGEASWAAWRTVAAHALSGSLQAVLPLSYLCSTSIATQAPQRPSATLKRSLQPPRMRTIFLRPPARRPSVSSTATHTSWTPPRGGASPSWRPTHRLNATPKTPSIGCCGEPASASSAA